MCLTVSVVFGALGTYGAYINYISKGSDHSIEFYLGARNSQPMLAVAWGLFGTVVGAGLTSTAMLLRQLLLVPASYIADPVTGTGYLGMIALCTFTGLPLLLATLFGPIVRAKTPLFTSIGTFADWRFGRTFGLITTLITLFTMTTTLILEYQSLANVFTHIIGSPVEKRSAPIICAGTVVLIYVLIGGLQSSIAGAQYQSMFAMLVFAVTLLYLGALFRPGDLGTMPTYLNTTDRGKASFVSIGTSLTASTVFSDAFWQRVWSAQTDSAIIFGSIIGGVLATTVSFIFGVFSLLSAWIGLATTTNASTLFFRALDKYTPEADTQKTSLGPVWLTTLICMASVGLNASVVSAYQSALTNTVMSAFLTRGFKPHAHFARFVLLVVNIPIMVLAVTSFDAAVWVGAARLVAACAAIPLCLGMLSLFDKVVTEAGCMFGSIAAVACVILYGWVTVASGFVAGVRAVFLEGHGGWIPFFIAVVISSSGTLLFAFVNIGIRSMYGWPLPEPPKPAPQPPPKEEKKEDKPADKKEDKPADKKDEDKAEKPDAKHKPKKKVSACKCSS
ncbi:hypothetical protein BASA50_000857 [Batrachochytrium salamandrivorans]|uniref:Uncharacterized protein n=1 Tax=Batrachochytrium salamandrivorans TaxID=1357716 RepID=A0ABQ8ESU5_9FUNG|nr:hypothetical protein BASA50_000857 [Batrachochytrium salamandrivorans]